MQNKLSPTCALILIGSELLSGRTPDANLNHLARRMTEEGIEFKEARVIPDDEQVIIQTVNELRAKYTYVFTTGGIGPTHDDITMACIAEAFGVGVRRDAEVEKAFRDAYPDREESVTQSTLKMADFPEGAELIKNEMTLAPGFRMENVYVMAGIPKVMQAMLETIMPMLEKGPKIASLSVEAFVAESQISKPFEVIQKKYPTVDLGSYPRRVNDRYCTSLVARSADEQALHEAFGEVEQMLDGLQAERIL